MGLEHEVWVSLGLVIGGSLTPEPIGSLIGMSALERHYTAKEVSAMWGWSPKTVIRRFRNEPGVLVVKREEMRNKRPYSQLSIPESVLVRVHERLTVKQKF